MVVGDQAGSESFKSLNTVEFDQYSMGAKLAQKLLADNNGTLSGKKIGIYCENTESDACKKRIDGIKDTLAESGCVVMWIVSGVSDTGEKINLQSQRKVDIVLAIDDASVVDAAKEASDNNLQGALVYGIGNSTEAIYYLDSGWTEALITPDEFAAGYKSVVGLVDMLRGSRKYSVEEKPVSYQLLTRKNLFDEENDTILTAAMINNYVKLKLIPKAEKKRYNRMHIAYLIAITILKQVLTISEVKQGIEYQAGINGLKEAFNLFCEEQEAAIKAVADHLKNQDSTFLLERITVQNTAIKMATMSFAGKLVAEKILHLQNSYTARL